MKKTAIIYWSGTGNTEAMAQAVQSGAQEAGAVAELFTADSFNAASIPEYDALAFGCPSMGDEVLEEGEFEPMFNICLPALKGKSVALFGSYGWGDGEWMRNWEETCINAGLVMVADPVICTYQPDETAVQQCKDLGAALAK